MITTRLFLATLVCSSFLLSTTTPAATETPPPSALQTVSEFYHQYLNPNTRNKRLDLPYSQSLQRDIAVNTAICKKFADGPCGWGADRNLYLDAQESDPKLNDTNANLHFTAKPGNIIEVSFDLFPFEKPKEQDHRVMQLKMVYENQAWVLDDVIFEYTGSERKNMQEENTYYLQPGNQAPVAPTSKTKKAAP